MRRTDPATAELVRLVGQTRRRLWIAAARALAARTSRSSRWSLVTGSPSWVHSPSASWPTRRHSTRPACRDSWTSWSGRGSPPGNRSERPTPPSGGAHRGGRPVVPADPAPGGAGVCPGAGRAPSERATRRSTALLRKVVAETESAQRSSRARSTVQSTTISAARPSQRRRTAELSPPAGPRRAAASSARGGARECGTLSGGGGPPAPAGAAHCSPPTPASSARELEGPPPAAAAPPPARAPWGRARGMLHRHPGRAVGSRSSTRPGPLGGRCACHPSGRGGDITPLLRDEHALDAARSRFWANRW